MPHICLPVRGAISSENVSYLQFGPGHPGVQSLQASPQRLILQIGQHLVGADRVLDRLGGHMGVLRRGRQFGVAQQYLDHSNIGIGLQQMRRETVAQRV